MAKRVKDRVSERRAKLALVQPEDLRQIAMFLAEEIHGKPAAGPRFLFKEIWAWWKPLFLFRIKSAKTFEGRMENHLLPKFGELDSQTMTPEVVEAGFADMRRANASPDKKVVRDLGPQSIKHIRNCGRKVINDAIRLEKWKGKNPFVGIKSLPKIPKKKHKETLLPWEARKLLSQFRPSYRPIFAIVIYLGLRKKEILRMQVRDIRMDRKALIIRRFKVESELEVPIPEELVPHLQAALLQARGEFLFTREDGSPLRGDTKLELILRTALGHAGIVHGYDHKCRRCGRFSHVPDNTRRACDRCGMTLWVSAVPRKITFRGLRHVCSNLHRRAGCDPLVIREVLGHETEGLALTDIVYTHIDEPYMRTELNKLSLFQNEPPPEGGGVGPNSGGATSDNSPWPPEPKATGSTPVSRAFDASTHRLLTVAEVGAVLRCSAATVRKLHRKGRLPGFWVGSSLRFSQTEVVAFMANGGAQ